MPIKICYPAIESHGWRIVTGCDPKNTRWSYHNRGSWPVAVLLWLLTAACNKTTACNKTGRPQIARKAIELAESRLLKDGWPEYYDGKLGRYRTSGSKRGSIRHGRLRGIWWRRCCWKIRHIWG
ncbi:hypothetical protein LXL04_024124 [Taraxacum kok-saghyz]